MPPEASPVAPQRLISLDAFRGLVMLLMMAEVLRFASVAQALPGSPFWAFLAHHQTHVEWVGCSLHDLIQPSFSFIVGVALPFSIAARLARGQTRGRMTLHAFSRALILILLGLFLRSVGKPQTYFTFEDTLSQIGLGYGFLFILGFRPVRDQWIAFALLLAGYWLAFACYPAPRPGFDYASVGVPPDWLAQHGLTGVAAHWNKNSNLAWAFDTWFLNLFPREKPFLFNVGGYATLSFIPTLATMILGLIAGETLRSNEIPVRKLRWLALAGLISLAAGWLLGALGVCPIVKRIWTPSWTLFSGGWGCLLLAVFYLVIDIGRLRAWAFPLVVVGLNSIAAYCMAHLFEDFIRSTLITHLGKDTFQILGKPCQSLLLGGATLLILWLMLLWMQRRKILLRI
jgi:heparan-alpha-glucosaminide N-acetyltransferase